MSKLTDGEALQKRRELVELGYCVIPGILHGDLLERLRAYTDELFRRKTIDTKYRYQGSDIHIGTTRVKKAAKHEWLKDYSLIVDELIDLPAAWEACRAWQSTEARAFGGHNSQGRSCLSPSRDSSDTESPRRQESALSSPASALAPKERAPRPAWPNQQRQPRKSLRASLSDSDSRPPAFHRLGVCVRTSRAGRPK